ncbi:FkbM family methyltransferase [Streptomyces sp. NPDC057702]|uniref:FkbM family methyltransferase n=1 Tax=unclassified Streptomyces TaxID=2593676 RepID=UPI00367893D0
MLPSVRLRASDLMTTLGRGYVRNAPGSLLKGRLAAHYLNPRLRDHPRQRVVTTRFGALMACDSRDLIQRYIQLFGAWEVHMTRWMEGRLRPGDVLVDVGANVGYFSLLGSGLVGPEGRVVALEASPVSHGRVLRHIAVNGIENIRAVNAAVSDREETLTFVLASSRNTGANSIVPYDGPAESTFDATAYPLTELLEADEIARARVIKIDVEGAEGAVVRGLLPALDRMRPDVELAVEVTPARMEKLGFSVEDLLEAMRVRGFHTYRLTNDYRAASYPQALRRPEPPRRWDRPISGEMDVVFSRVDADVLD